MEEAATATKEIAIEGETARKEEHNRISELFPRHGSGCSRPSPAILQITDFGQACHKESLALQFRCLESLLDSEAVTDALALKAPLGTAATASVALLDLESMQVRILDTISTLPGRPRNPAK